MLVATACSYCCQAARLVSELLDKDLEHMKATRDWLENSLKTAFGDNVVVNGTHHPRLPNTCNFSFVKPGGEPKPFRLFTTSGLTGRRVLDLMGTCIAASVGAACHSELTARYIVTLPISAYNLQCIPDSFSQWCR